MDCFVQNFLNPKSLARIFVNASNSANAYVVDPVSDIVCAMLNNPIVCVLSTTGLMPFKNTPNIILPYSYMDNAQKTYLRTVLEERNKSSSCTRKSNCLEIHFDHKTKQSPTHLKPETILLVMCESIIATAMGDTTEEHKRLAICNILLQRVRCSVNLRHDIFVYLQTQLQDRFPKSETCKLQKDILLQVDSDASDHTSEEREAQR